MEEYNGKIVVVSGAAKGIARLTCEQLLSKGAIVVGADHNEPANISTDFMNNERFTYIKTDLTVEQDILHLFSEVERLYGKLDILLNIAGGFKSKYSIADTPLEEWEKVCAFNQTSVFLMCRSAVPLMRKAGGGRIVNFSSTAGVQPVAHANVAYAAAKAAVVGMSRYLAGELAKDHITVNVVNPTTTLTERVKLLRTPEDLERIGNKIPVGRPGLPEDSVNAVMFLISEKSSFITGQTINVVGGTYMN